MDAKSMQWNENTYSNFRVELLSLADAKYREFHSSLCKTTALPIAGVRLPKLQAIAKELVKGDVEKYLNVCTPMSYEEVMLKGLVIAHWKLPLADKIPYIEAFLPQVDNWAVCDSFCSALKPKKQEYDLLFSFCQQHIKEKAEYTVRIAVVLLLDYLLEEPYFNENLNLMRTVSDNRYYVQMAVAWNLSVCYVKAPQKTLAFLKQNPIDENIMQYTIQKIQDSFRVSSEDKSAIRILKREKM